MNAHSRQFREAWRAHVDALKSQYKISEVVSKWTKLEKAGKELVGLCLNHNEHTPSMRVNDAKGTVWCFACEFTGDIFDVVQLMTGLSFREAVEWLDGAGLSAVDPQERRVAIEREEAQRKLDIETARRFWADGISPDGTPAEVYLRQARGITIPLPPSVRFGMVPAWRDRDTGEWSEPQPAVLFAVFDKAGEVCGIQRIFVRNGGLQKARMEKPKLSLGRIKGGSLRLGDPQRRVILCEGPEDGLSLMQGLPGAAVWPTLGTAMMPAVEFPNVVREIVIAGQNDDAGRVAVNKAAAALGDQGFLVSTMFPDPQFKDWNDQLRGIAR